jgi:hypothetical protein
MGAGEGDMAGDCGEVVGEEVGVWAAEVAGVWVGGVISGRPAARVGAAVEGGGGAVIVTLLVG